MKGRGYISSVGFISTLTCAIHPAKWISQIHFNTLVLVEPVLAACLGQKVEVFYTALEKCRRCHNCLKGLFMDEDEICKMFLSRF